MKIPLARFLLLLETFVRELIKLKHKALTSTEEKQLFRTQGQLLKEACDQPFAGETASLKKLTISRCNRGLELHGIRKFLAQLERLLYLILTQNASFVLFFFNKKYYMRLEHSPYHVLKETHSQRAVRGNINDRKEIFKMGNLRQVGQSLIIRQQQSLVCAKRSI